MGSEVLRKGLGDYFEVLGVGGLVDGSGDEVVEGPMLDLSFFLEGGLGRELWVRWLCGEPEMDLSRWSDGSQLAVVVGIPAVTCVVS